MPKSSMTPPDPVSKSQVKRDMIALQKIGKALIDLSEAQLKSMPLPDFLYEAILHARTLKKDESMRRQLQYIGKLMRNADHEAIESALKNIKFIKKAESDEFHQAEQWREKLILEGDDKIQQFIELHPQAERQTLRQLVRKSQQDRKNEKNTGGEKALFRYVREFIKN